MALECTYELYGRIYAIARQAVRAKDEAKLTTIRAAAARRSGGAQAAFSLALEDALADRPRRSRLDVCRPLCTDKCERAV